MGAFTPAVDINAWVWAIVVVVVVVTACVAVCVVSGVVGPMISVKSFK